MTNIDLKINKDGSYGLYNTEYNDIYFASIGGYKEAMLKFVLPSDIKSYSDKKINILDACYGMGYNSKSFVNFLYKINKFLNVEIDAVELDENILSLSILNLEKNISPFIHELFFDFLFNSNFNIKNPIEILGENGIKNILNDLLKIFNKKISFEELYLYEKDDFKEFLHNIYYQTNTHSNNISKKTNYFTENIRINFKITDLLEFSYKTNKKYDLIFHDAFSQTKQPALWSLDLFKQYYNILNNNGKILTYSFSSKIRERMREAGFKIISNDKYSKKSIGTIAIKI